MEVTNYFVNLDGVERLFKNFKIKWIRHFDECYFYRRKYNGK